MLVNIGDLPTGTTVPFFFPAYDANGASVTITGLAVTDIEIYKGTSMTQRASDNGYALIDTDGIDLDSITGIHGFSVDMSDNSDSGFYAAGNYYHIVVDAITVAGQTVRFIFRFSLGFDLRPATAGRTAVVDSAGLIDANTVKVGPTGSGTAQTARDIGASVLLSNGTGTGQVKLSSGYISPNWADVGNPTTTVNLSGTTVKDATDVNTDTDTLLSRMGTPSNLGGGATLAGNLSDIEGQTDDIGTAGAGLTNVPWNASWDAEVESECTDALNAYDPPTHAELTSGLAGADDAVLAAIAALNNISTSQVGTVVNASIETYHLHRLFHSAYDPASKPGNASGLLNVIVENDGGVPRFTTNVLELGPSSSGGDATAANQTTIINHLLGIKGASWGAGDNLKAIEDAVAALSAGTGVGAFSVPLTVYQTGGATLVPECDVVLTTTNSSPSTNIYASGRTNANGIVTFQCDAGTYYIWRQKAGLNFSNPKTLTVAANGSSTVS